MARIVMSIRVETDLVQDAHDLIVRIAGALSHRHGERFRRLDRRIDALFDGQFELPTPIDLGEGILLFKPPPEFVAVIDEARSMGVI